ncbi:MAG: PQQ-like beta-propeller repeat protein [Bryobacterales bacterium]|nr:PQQ-like beta-propeller repeat protein [Bryobacterales bacterium]
MNPIRRSLLLMPSALLADDWPQWRGILRDGKSPEKGVAAAWPAGGPPLAWKAEGLGEGYSAVSVAQGRVYTLGQRGDTQYVMAFDEASGKKLWETASGGAYRERRGDGPRGVPTVEGERLWAVTADGKLVNLEAKTGKLLWTVDFVKQHGGSVPHWGYSESPLIEGKLLIVTPGGSGASVVALDKLTGKLVWKSQSDEAAYSSPVAATVGGVRMAIVFTASGVMGLRMDNGELLWRYDKVANGTANVATPIVHENQVFVSSDYGTGCALLKLEATGPGSVKATEVYFSREMKNHHASSVLVNGHLYGFSSSILTAMKWDTGEVSWRDRATGKGSVVYADGHLVALGENGNVALVQIGTGAYKEISRFAIELTGRPAWAPPVIAQGRLYIRDQDRLFSYRLRS